MSGTKALLNEMLQLLKDQVGHVVAGRHQELIDGAYRHEQMLAELAKSEPDGSAEELRSLAEQIELEKQKLQSLLEAESTRVDFELRIMMGGRKPATPGYPDMKRRGDGSGILNRRT